MNKGFGTILAELNSVRPRLRLILIAAVSALLLFLAVTAMGTARRAPAGTDPAGSHARTATSGADRPVRVQTELVTAEVAAPVPSAARAAVRRVAPAPRRQPARDAGLLRRAARAVLGDGRHRPSPFPRVKDQSGVR